MLNFDAFEEYLSDDNVDAAKSIVTPANAQARRARDGYGVVFYLCWYGPNDPGLLHHFVKLGATLELDSAFIRDSPLHAAAFRGNYKQMRALLDLGVPVDIFCSYNYTPLYYSLGYQKRKCTRLLLDAGAKLGCAKQDLVPNWVYDFVTKREQTRTFSVIILGLLRCNSKVTGQNGKDILRIVARCLWGLRGL